MTIKIMELPEPQNVLAAAAGTAVIPRIPQGFIYKAIVLVLGGTFVAADISELKLRLGGNVIWDTTGADLATINAYNSLGANASFLPMHFADRTAKTPAGERFGEIDTKNLTYSDFSLEVKLDGTQTGATLKAFAVIDTENKPMTADGNSTASIVRSLVKAEHSRSAAGVFDLDIPVGSDQGNIVRAVHFMDPSDVLTQYGLKKDSGDICDLLPVEWLEFVQDEVLRTSQANHFCYDPQPDGIQANGIDTRRFNDAGQPVGRGAMRWRAGYSGSGVLTSYSDLYGTVATL
tara:strand:- start:100259 stop:101128 length:870 start_codon:yes stop_codon:yes gene_type:complete